MLKKRTVIWASLIISFIMMVVSIVSYFEIWRYYKLKSNSIETYAKTYSKLPAGSDSRVVVSFNVDKPIQSGFINSILDQTVRVNAIDANVSLSNKDAGFVPNEYAKVISVYYIGSDYGMYNGFLPTLERETDKNTIIIAVDPDYIYPTDMIQSVLDHVKENTSCMYTIQKKDRVVVIAGKSDCVKSDCFYSSTNTSPLCIKNKTLEQLATDKVSIIDCPHVYCF